MQNWWVVLIWLGVLVYLSKVNRGKPGHFLESRLIYLFIVSFWLLVWFVSQSSLFTLPFKMLDYNVESCKKRVMQSSTHLFKFATWGCDRVYCHWHWERSFGTILSLALGKNIKQHHIPLNFLSLSSTILPSCKLYVYLASCFYYIFMLNTFDYGPDCILLYH